MSALGCNPNGTVELFLLRSIEETQHPLDPDLVSHVRISVEGKGMSPKEKTYRFVPGGTSKLLDIPVGNNRVITVEGLGSAEDSHPLSRGRTLPLRVTQGHNEANVFIARVKSFSFGPDTGLADERFAQTVAVSEEGQVYIAGGAGGGNFDAPEDLLSSVEAFDPMSGETRRVCKACLSPRALAPAAAVEDGFLLVGGQGEAGPMSSVELFDTQLEMVERWEGRVIERSHTTSVAVNDVTLIAGGLNASLYVLDALEVIDGKGTIEKRALPEPRWGMAAAAAGSFGFFFGGLDENNEVTGDYIMVDPLRDRAQRFASEVEPRAFASAVKLSDGRVLVLGGLTADGTPSTSVDMYDPRRQLFCHIGEFDLDMGGRWHAAAVTLLDGRVLVTGGLVGNAQATFTSRIVDPRYVELGADCGARIFGLLGDEVAASTKYRRYLSSAVQLRNGNVLVAGGLNDRGVPISQTEIYVPE